MNAHITKMLAVTAAVCITAGSIGLRAELPKGSVVSAKTIAEIEQEKQEKEAEIRKNQETLAELESSISDNKAYQEALTSQITLITDKLSLIDTQLVNLSNELTAQEQEGAALEGQIAEQEQAVQKGLSDFKTRIRTLYIHDLCVDESARGRGVGTALMDAAVDWARAQRCHNIDLNVWEFNEGAKAFYERYGMHTMKRYMEILL